MTASEVALRKGLDNTPPQDILIRLADTAERMDQVRTLLGAPIYVNSAYRSPLVNKAVGGVPTSAHQLGYAVDFVCPSFGTPLAIVQEVQTSGIHFDQVIQEGTWVHISFDPRMRGQILTANFSGGKATYTQGVAR